MFNTHSFRAMNKYHIFSAITLLLMTCLLFVSCITPRPPKHPLFQSSSELPSYSQNSFTDYVVKTEQWIRDNRAFLTDQHEIEIHYNTPFEVRPVIGAEVKRGILFIHGLGSSPGYFHEIANGLANKGFLVRVILLPGHGTKPADLLLPKYSDWENIIDHHVELLLNEVDELWLGGFSTGANLATTHAYNNDSIAGLLLLSPGFYPYNYNKLRFSALASYFCDWLDIDEEDNILSYHSLSSFEARIFFKSLKMIQRNLNRNTYDKPTLITMSQHDSVLDPYATIDAFSTRFLNPKSRFVWYGSLTENNDNRVMIYNSYLPDQQISAFSHMNVLFSSGHDYYGVNGSHIMWDNGQRDIRKPAERSELWFSAWGYNEEGKYHARLTWNPYFDELLDIIYQITGTKR